MFSALNPVFILSAIES